MGSNMVIYRFCPRKSKVNRDIHTHTHTQREREREREKNEEGRGEPIYKGKGEQICAKIKEEPNKWLSSYTGASILGKH